MSAPACTVSRSSCRRNAMKRALLAADPVPVARGAARPGTRRRSARRRHPGRSVRRTSRQIPDRARRGCPVERPGAPQPTRAQPAPRAPARRAGARPSGVAQRPASGSGDRRRPVVRRGRPDRRAGRRRARAVDLRLCVGIARRRPVRRRAHGRRNDPGWFPRLRPSVSERVRRRHEHHDVEAALSSRRGPPPDVHSQPGSAGRALRRRGRELRVSQR